MKRKRIKHGSLLLATILLATSVIGAAAANTGQQNEVEPERDPYQINWGFEDGTLNPFNTEDTFGKPVTNRDVDRNDKKTPVNKEGRYYLSTVEVANPDDFDESFTGSIQSPPFKIMDPVIRFKIAGGSNEKNYVAVCRASDGTEIAKLSRPSVNGDSGSHVFQDVQIDLGENYQENEIVYLKIVDGTTSSWGFINVDDFSLRGMLYHEYTDIHWSFEDGTASPFTTTDEFGKLVVDRDVDRNDKKTPMNKDGKYYLSTVEVEDPLKYNESFQGELRSPVIYLAEPTVTLKISGGGPDNYVAVCRESDNQELARVSSPKNAHPFQDVTLDLGDNFIEGEAVYLKIVDATTSGWGFIQVDDIRFRGAVHQDPIVDIVFDFEGGVLDPFEITEGSFGKPIGNRDVDFNGSIPIEKQGKYYLTTVESGSGYSDSYMGVIKSPTFTIDVKNNPIVTFLIGGGSDSAKEYVALCKEDGSIVAKATSSRNLYVFEEQQWDLTGKVSEYDRLHLEIVDNSSGAWGQIMFDNFRAVGTFPGESGISTEEQFKELTGWDTQGFDQLQAAVEDLVATYGPDYGDDPTYLDQIAACRAEMQTLIQEKTKPSNPSIEEFKSKVDELAKTALTANPLVSDAPIAFVTRHQYATDHHNTHTMFPSYEGEHNDGYYEGGGTLKTIDFGNGGQISTLLELPEGVVRDPDVSYDGNKLLASVRNDYDDSYHIYEYTLNEDKTAITETKQLTYMTAADDMDPMYMPSGNIVFSSTRDPKYVMCNRHIAANLYRMEGDGANIVKITNSTLFERPSDLLPDGRILYDRWEYNDRDFGSAQGIWTVGEDGTQQVTYYGNNSPTGQVIDAKSIPDTQKVMAILSSTHDRPWGALAIIDRSKGVDGKKPVERTWPAEAANTIKDPNEAYRQIDAFKGLELKYEDPQPLSDKYFLVTRQIPGKGEKTGLYLLDTFGNEILIYEDEGELGAYDAVVLQPREKELVLEGRRDYKDGTGTFFVQNVYEGTHMQGVEPGSVKSLRIVESVPKYYFTRNNQWNAEGQQNPGVNWHSFEVKKVLGEVPVYEDGSAYFEVPQDKFVYFQLLDEEGRMIQSMRSGTLVQSGEKTGCIGCHEDRRIAVPTGTTEKSPQALQQNFEVVENPDYTEGSDLPKTIGVNTPDVPILRGDTEPTPYEELENMNYLTEVQPIFTANCLECHGYDRKEADLTLVPDKNYIFNASYVDLWRGRGKEGVRFNNLLGAIGAGGQEFTTAKSWGSYASPLINKLYDPEDPHYNRLTAKEKAKVAEWVDLNATYYGDYSSNYATGAVGRSPLTYNELMQIPGFQTTFGWGDTRPAQIYFDNPEKSPLLKNLSGKDYDTALAWIWEGHNRLKEKPDVDWAGLTTMPGNPSVSINPYQLGEQDAWRDEKHQLRDAIEAANRKAIDEGRKRYDTDNAKEGLLETPSTPFPGFDK